MGQFGFTQKVMACAPGLMNPKAVMCIDDSVEKGVEYTERYGPVAKQMAGKAADVGKDAAVDFAMTAAEVYRQECKSENNRGRDEDFFLDRTQQTPVKDEHSMLAGVGGESKTVDSDDSGIEDYTKKLHSVAETESSVHLNGPTTTIFRNQSQMQQQQHQVPWPNRYQESAMSFESHTVTPKQPSKRINIRKLQRKTQSAPKGRSRFPKTDELMVTPPPQVSRSVDSKKAFKPGRSPEDLRATRMDLFRQSSDDNPGLRITRALEDLDKQDQIINSLKKQLQITQSELDQTVSRLDEVRRDTHTDRFKATETQARAIQEKKKMEDRYQSEVTKTKRMQGTVSELQVEISSLRIALRDQARAKFGGDPTMSSTWEIPSSAEMISMRAEIVELRSQLAEAHANNIDDSASVKTFEELDDLKYKLLKTEEELREIREREQSYQELEEQLFQAKNYTMETEAKLKEELKKASDTESDLLSELSQTKAILQRLESERSRDVLYSSAELEASREEVVKLQEELSYQKSIADEEINQLNHELQEMKYKVSLTMNESMQKKTEALNERIKVENNLAKQTQAIQNLQQQIHSKDEKMISHVRQIAELEGMLGERGVDAHSHLKRIAFLEREVKSLAENEKLLQQELDLQKTLLKEEREESIKLHASKLDIDKDSVWRLRERLEKVKESEGSSTASKAEGGVGSALRETALKNEILELKKQIALLENGQYSEESNDRDLLKEISTLKSMLQETEAKGRVDKLRAEEERRMSRENANSYERNLVRLRNEKEYTLNAKNEMEEELVELRKKLISVTQENIASTTVKAKDADNSETSGNVTRLRKELAAARSRLATAREGTRTFDGDSISTTSPKGELKYSQQPSDVSQLSTWAPPTSEDNGVVVSTASTPQATSDAAASTSFDSKIFTTNIVTPTVTPEKASREKLFAQKSGDNSDLQRRLEESRKRLDQANSKLDVLLGPRLSHDGQSYRPLSSIVVVGNGTEQDEYDGIIDEVFSRPSGSIEITQRPLSQL
jgi:hypothetical protein